VQFKGKQRLLLVAAVLVALVAVLAVAGARWSRPNKPAAASETASNINGGTTATPEEVQRLKSYALVVGELPPGSQLRVGEELRNYAVAAGSAKNELAVAQKGRIDGFYQVWIQTLARYQFRATIDLYNVPASARAVIEEARKSDSSPDIQALPDPKLGDASRMYEFTSDQAGQKYQGWAVQWVRGRTTFSVDGLGPVGDLHPDDVLSAARRVDSRAERAPIK